MEAGERTIARGPETAMGGGGPSAADLERGSQRRHQTSQLLAASRSAVSRALSSNSDTFLRQVRQQSGQ